MTFPYSFGTNQQKRSRRGIALILVVSLLAFLILIVTALSALLRVETQILNTAEKQAIARQNALNGLEIAISELQKYGGPDQRVTARADLFDDPEDLPNPWLTGVWDTRNENSLPAWLISGNEEFDLRGTTRPSGPLSASTYPDSYVTPFDDLPTPDTSDQIIWLLHPPENEGDLIPLSAIWAPKRPLYANNLPGQAGQERVVGHYAYWVGDEGVKASVGLSDTFNQRLSELLDSGWPEEGEEFSNSEVRRIGQKIPKRPDLETIFPNEEFSGGYNPAWDDLPWINLSSFDEARGLDEEFQSLPEEFWQERSPHFTATSLGVLANPHPSSDGGLKVDLSTNPEEYFRSSEATVVSQFLDFSSVQESLSFPSADLEGTLDINAFSTEPTRRGDFRRRYHVRPPVTGGEVRDSISPVLTEFYMIFTLRKANSGSDIIVRSRFYATLWNPYSSALVPANLYLDIAGLPEVTMVIPYVPLNEDDSGDDVEIEIDLQEAMTNATNGAGESVYRVSLEFPPEDFEFPGYDAASWLPGRVYSWVGPNNASGAGLSTEEGQAQFYNNRVDDGIWQQTIEDASYPSPFARYPEFGLEGEEASLSLSLLTSDTPGDPLVQINPINFESFESSENAFGRENNTLQFGFRVRLGEAGDEADDPWSKMQWFRLNDPRSPNPSYTPDATDITLPYFTPVNVPNPLLHTSTAVRRREWLFDRTMGGTGKRPMEDIPLFERPGQQVLSIGSLQHLQFANREPLAIGNSWGGELNRVFDHHFLSGKEEGNSYAFNGSRLPPNHRLVPTRTNATDPDSLPNSAKYLVNGHFNVNSASAQAWRSILLGSVLRSGDPESLEKFSYLNLYNRESGSDGTRSGTVHTNSPLREISNDRFGVFSRFANTLEETYFVGNVRQTGGHSGLRDQRRAEFFRRGMNALREGDGMSFDVSLEIAESLRDNIRAFAQAEGRPFYSMEEFLNPLDSLSVSGKDIPSSRPVSVLEHALFSQEDLYFFRADDIDRSEESNGFQASNNDGTRPMWPMTPGFLLQSDVMTALAPITNVRSDTFVIRAYGDYTNPVNGRVEGRAWCEAVVQRVPDTVTGESVEAPDPEGPGRQFQIISFRWLQKDEL
ncbi:MAG: hypothetical protein LAT58_09705 [Opitutales bacterium]|nr:hypothetical protein [Opitutales bacterium]